MNKNEKTFRLVNKTNQVFSIIIAGFEYAATLLVNIRLKSRIITTVSLFIKAYSIITIKKVRLVISQVKLIVKITQTINSRTIKLLVTFRQRMKAISIIYLRNPMGFISKARQKIVSIIAEGRLTISTSPIFVILYTLGHWDVETLLTLDALTLGDMDYEVV